MHQNPWSILEKTSSGFWDNFESILFKLQYFQRDVNPEIAATPGIEKLSVVIIPILNVPFSPVWLSTDPSVLKNVMTSLGDFKCH